MGEKVGLVNREDGLSSAFGVLGGEGVGGLGERSGVLEAGPAAEAGDELVADTAGAGGGVGDVDEGVAGLVEGGDRGAGGDGFAGAGLADDQADGALRDAPADPGDGLVVAGVVVQHPWGQGLSERGLREAVVGVEPLNHGVWSFESTRMGSMAVWARSAMTRPSAATWRAWAAWSQC